MSKKITIAADEAVKKTTWQMWGLTLALEALGGDNPKSSLPGFAFAKALIEQQIGEQRAHLCRATYRCAAKAGQDVATMGSIHTKIEDGKISLEIEPADLVDLTEE